MFIERRAQCSQKDGHNVYSAGKMSMSGHNSELYIKKILNLIFIRNLRTQFQNIQSNRLVQLLENGLKSF